MKTKLTPPKWTDVEEYEQAYRECQKWLRWITVLGVILCMICNVVNTYILWPVPHPYYWVIWGIGTGALTIAIASLFFSLVIKHDYPNVVAWYEENQGDDAVTINE